MQGDIHGEAVPGQFDGGLHHRAQGQRAVMVQGVYQPCHRAGNPRGQMAEVGPALVHFTFPGQEHIPGGSGGRGFPVVDKNIAVFLGQVNQHEAPAANVARPGQGDCQRKARGDGGIHRIAALGEHRKARLAGQPLGTDHHVAPGRRGYKATSEVDQGCVRWLCLRDRGACHQRHKQRCKGGGYPLLGHRSCPLCGGLRN